RSRLAPFFSFSINKNRRMPKFVIMLKNEKLKTYTLISWLIISLNFVAFLYVGISPYEGVLALPFYTAAILSAIFLFRFIIHREMAESDSLSLSFSVAIIAWIILQFYRAAIAIFILFLFQDISRRKLTVLVYDDRIVYPS